MWTIEIEPSHHGKPRWNRLRLPFYGNISLGNGTLFKMGAMLTDQGRLFVGLEYKGAYTFGGWAHWSYVQEKLGLSEADARNLADWINTQTGQIVRVPQEQGEYDIKFTDGPRLGTEKQDSQRSDR